MSTGIQSELFCPRFEQFRWHFADDASTTVASVEGLPLREWLESGQAQIVKRAPHRTIYRVDLPTGGLFIKYYPSVDARGWLRQYVRPAKARTEFHRAHELARRGIATFTPVAVGEATGESVLVSQEIAGAEPLDAWLMREFADTCAANETVPLSPRGRGVRGEGANVQDIPIPHPRPLSPKGRGETTSCHLGRAVASNGMRLRITVCSALARFVVQLHAAGVRHNDFHPGNILIRFAGEQPEFFLIDLHAVQLGEPLSRIARRDNLAMLNNWFAARVSRSDRLRFLHAYWRFAGIAAPGNQTSCTLAASSTSPQGEREALLAAEARRIETQSWQSMAEIWRQRDRRCLGRNRYYRTIVGAVCTGHALADLDAALIQTLGADPDEPFRRRKVRILKNSRSSSVIEFHTGGRAVIYKRFNVAATLAPLLSVGRRSKALRSWFFGQCLFDRFLPTPRPLLVLQSRRGFLKHECYLLTEKVENALHLHDFLASIATAPLAEQRRLVSECIEQIARVVREMHRHGFSHRDLKACNILVSRAGEAIKIWLIDLVGVERPTRLSWRRKIQNLARLHASFHRHPAITNGDKRRFLQIYLQCGLYGSRNWKMWWRAIGKATLAKVDRNRRIGRPLA